MTAKGIAEDFWFSGFDFDSEGCSDVGCLLRGSFVYTPYFGKEGAKLMVLHFSLATITYDGHLPGVYLKSN